MGMREDDRTSPKNRMIQMDLKTVRIVWETQDNVGEIVVLTRLRRIALVMGRDAGWSRQASPDAGDSELQRTAL